MIRRPSTSSRDREGVVSRRRPLGRTVRRLPLVAWLVLVWVLLWGTYDAGTVFFGAVVAVLVVAVFPAPPIATNFVLRPLRIAHLVLLLAWDLMVSTARVAWQALRQGPRTKAGIVEVTLVTDSDHLTAMVANAVSLAPGTFVLQIDRANRICYVYQLGMLESEAESVRRSALAWERRVVLAVGTAEEVAMVNRAASEGGTP